MYTRTTALYNIMAQYLTLCNFYDYDLELIIDAHCECFSCPKVNSPVLWSWRLSFFKPFLCFFCFLRPLETLAALKKDSEGVRNKASEHTRSRHRWGKARRQPITGEEDRQPQTTRKLSYKYMSCLHDIVRVPFLIPRQFD